MAVTWNVTGPCDIWVSGATTTMAKLGRTSNDSLFSVSEISHLKIETDVAQGASPAQAIGNNIEAVLNCTLVEWDVDVLAALRARCYGGSGGTSATVGKIMLTTAYTDGGYFQLEVRPTITGRKGAIFYCCLADGESFKESEWGNAAKKLGVNVRAIPNPVDNILYAYTTAS